MEISRLIDHIADRLKPELHDHRVCVQYAWWLLEKLTDLKHTDLIIRTKLELNDEQQKKLEQWIHAIVQEHKPIAYILEEVPFGDLMITVRPPVLIPRMETEEWVLNLIDRIQQAGMQRFTALDMCAGSGCIGLLIAATFAQATVYAVDICADARALIEENKARLGIKNLHVIASDLYTAVPHDIKFDLIVSNPPYITAQEYAELAPSVAHWEHKHALFAQEEGLALIKQIIIQAANYVRHNACMQRENIPQLTLEIGYRQGKAVERCMLDAGFVNVRIEQDSAHKDRVVSGSLTDVAISQESCT